MYHCVKKCGTGIGSVVYWTEPKAECPWCGSKVIKERKKKKVNWTPNANFGINIGWRPGVKDVGIDPIYCPTKAFYKDKCKNARVMKVGGGIERRELIPVGVQN